MNYEILDDLRGMGCKGTGRKKVEPIQNIVWKNGIK